MTAEPSAARVVLMRPDAEDPVLVDAFHRVEAELRLHRFETELVDPPAGEAPSEALSEVAETSRALASIAFQRRAGKTAVDVWLVDRISGKTTMRRLEVGKSGDAASVLAIRTVDLLRVSLSEYDTGRERPPPDVVGVERKAPPPAAVEALVRREARFRLRVEGLLLFEGSEFGGAYGPALGLHYVSRPFELGVMLAGPLLGAELDTELGEATLFQGLGWGEMRVHLVDRGRFRASLSAGAGAHFLTARGRARAPLVSVDDTVWSAVFELGAHAELELSQSFALSASVRGLGFAPALGVAVTTEREELAQPSFLASLGVVVQW